MSVRCRVWAARRYTAPRSADEHDLAGRSGLKDLLVRARRLGEWQFLANYGAQGAVFETCKDPGVDVRLFGRRNSPEREPANRSAAPHQLTGIDGDLAATADHDDAAIIGQKFGVVGEVYVGEHLQNDVHAAVARRLQNFFLISGFAVIEDLMRPLLLGDFQAFWRSCSAKNPQTHGARDLKRRDAHTSTCAVHQDGFGSVRFRRVIQRMICGSIGYPNSCALLEINFRRKRMYLLFEREGVFRIRTAERSARCIRGRSLALF